MKITIYNPDATVFKEVILLDGSMMTNGIREDHDVTLCFSSEEELAIPEGAYVIFNGETFVAKSKSKMEMSHTRSYTYIIKMIGTPSVLSSVRLRNPADGKLSFPYTASAHDHLALIVSNMNRYGGGGWSVGDCIDGGDKFLQYNYISCRDALDSLADTYGTEWEIVGKTISLHKVEYNLDSPLELSYGKGSGLRPGIIRDNVQTPMTRLYTQGGSKNIDASEYGSTILLLPKSVTFKYDGNKFEDEQGFDETKARIYSTDSEGTYIKSHKNEGRDVNEGVIDCTDIYPNKLHTVLEVESGDNPRDIVLDIDENLDYSQYQIAGEVPTITFQSGELMGKTFEIRRDQGGVIMVSKKYSEQGSFVGWKLTLSGTFESGRWLPDTQSGLVPAAGDTCRIFGVRMSSQYISNNDTKSGASWDMLRRGIMYLYEYEDYIYSLKMPVDPIWARANWSSVGSKFVAGGYVRYSNSGWAQGGVVMRIKTIRQDISKPYSIEISLSNGIVGGGVLKGLSDSISNQAGSISEQQDTQKKLEYNVSSLGGDYVTIDTEQTITAKKTFADDVVLGGAVSEGVFGSMFVPSNEGPGKYSLYVSTDPVSGEAPTAPSGIDEDELWDILGGSMSSKVIDISHIPSIPTSKITGLDTVLAPYATQAWVQQQGYLASVSLATISDLNSGWDALLKAAPSYYSKAEIGSLLSSYYTKTEADGRFVGVSNEQTVSGKKTFSSLLTAGGGISSTNADFSGYVSADVLYVPYSGGNKMYSLYVSTDPVSGEQPSEGTGLDEEAMWTALRAADSSKVIDLSHIPAIPTSKITGLDNALASYATQEWTAGQYVKKSGDAMSGNLIVSGGAFYRKMTNDTSNAVTCIGWKKAADDTTLASVGYYNLRKAIYINSHVDEVADLWQDAVGKYTLYVGVNDLTYNTYPILRSDNIGSYALTPSNYASTLDSRYVKKAGDTMGQLILTTSTDDILIFNDPDGEKYFRIKAKANGTDWGGLVLDGRSSVQNLYLGTTTSGYKVWHSGNDGSGSGLDADLLDGQHGEWYQNNGLKFGRTTGTSTTGGYDANALIGKGGIMVNMSSSAYWTNTPADLQVGSIFHIEASNYASGAAQFAWDIIANSTTVPTRNLWFRAANNIGFANDWHQIAFTDSNVASATKLQTSRTLWGRPFDGTGNVSGDMTGVGSITASGNITTTNGLFRINVTNIDADRGLDAYYSDKRLFCGFGTSGNYGIYTEATGWAMSIHGTHVAITQNSGHNVGIGTTSPAYKLDVAGTLRATGRITAAGLTSSASIVANAGLSTTTLSASGAATLSSKLSVGGAATLKNGLTVTGTVTATGNIIAYSSSSRLVKDILPKRTTFSQRLTALGSVVDYRYNNVLKRDKYAHIGLIYENVRDTMPGMCHTHEGFGALNYLDTDYINLVAGAVQENIDDIAYLKNKVASLEMEVERLRRGLAA